MHAFSVIAGANDRRTFANFFDGPRNCLARDLFERTMPDVLRNGEEKVLKFALR